MRRACWRHPPSGGSGTRAALVAAKEVGSSRTTGATVIGGLPGVSGSVEGGVAVAAVAPHLFVFSIQLCQQSTRTKLKNRRLYAHTVTVTLGFLLILQAVCYSMIVYFIAQQSTRGQETSCETRTFGLETVTAACLNPECRTNVVWRGGRPKSYCSNRCFRTVQRQIHRLTDELKAVSEVLAQAITERARINAESRRTAIGWQLQRYAGALIGTRQAVDLIAAQV